MKRKVINVILVGALVAGLAGCGIGTQNADDGMEQETETEEYIDPSTLRSDFTEEELANGQASFRVSRYLWVDAEVTPAETYARDFASYYVEEVAEEGTMEVFATSPCIFAQPVDDALLSLSDVLGFSIPSDQLEFSMSENVASFSSENLMTDDGAGYYVYLGWTGNGASAECYATEPVIQIKKNAQDADEDALTSLDLLGSYFTDCEVYLESDPEEDHILTDAEVEEWRNTLADFTGRTLSDIWDCTHVTEDKLVDLYAVHSDDYTLYQLWDFDTALDDYSFYWDLGGLPIEYLGLTYDLEGEETYADDIPILNNKILYAAQQDAQELIMDDSGLIRLWITDLYQPGEEYREAQPVVSPSVPLAAVEEYYPEKSLTDNVTITQIRLVYSTYFTDPADGEMQNAFRPFWKVLAYDESKQENTLFVFDAVSGDVVMYGESLANR